MVLLLWFYYYFLVLRIFFHSKMEQDDSWVMASSAFARLQDGCVCVNLCKHKMNYLFLSLMKVGLNSDQQLGCTQALCPSSWTHDHGRGKQCICATYQLLSASFLLSIS